jgi:hypothetical protein
MSMAARNKATHWQHNQALFFNDGRAVVFLLKGNKIYRLGRNRAFNAVV